MSTMVYKGYAALLYPYMRKPTLQVRRLTRNCTFHGAIQTTTCYISLEDRPK